ncbi:MAG: hypothetical protein RR461_12545, partial [Angelakisella sp.]
MVQLYAVTIAYPPIKFNRQVNPKKILIVGLLLLLCRDMVYNTSIARIWCDKTAIVTGSMAKYYEQPTS